MTQLIFLIEGCDGFPVRLKLPCEVGDPVAGDSPRSPCLVDRFEGIPLQSGMGHSCLDGAFSRLGAFPDVFPAAEDVPRHDNPAAVVLVRDTEEGVGIVIPCGAPFERYRRNERAVGDAERMFGGIGIGLSR